jgi:hypothetical protein
MNIWSDEVERIGVNLTLEEEDETYKSRDEIKVAG